MTPGAAKYVVISPVKDEAKYLERTIQSVVQQTVRPYRWVIVDDGSRDQTPEIVARHSSSHSWLSAVRHEANSGREPGSAVVHAFSAGLATVRNLDFDFVVKLDADLELPPNYFEELLRRFEQDPRLGIASGVYLELHDGRWKMIQLPEYHAAGASKMIRVQCFKEIGGFVPNRGWDTVDEIKAMTRGWKTRHFAELQFRHLRLEGTAIGFVRTYRMVGEIYYLTGGGLLFFVLKTIRAMAHYRPWVLAALLMCFGYLGAVISRKPRLVSDTERNLYRRLLNWRIKTALSRVLPWMRPAPQPWRYT